MSAWEKIQERLRARTDPSLHVGKAPLGYRQKGVSTLVDADGKIKLQWQKTTSDEVDPYLLLDMFKGAIAEAPIAPAKPVIAPPSTSADRMVVYPMGDPHFGLLSWPEETGQDFNLQIAEQHLLAATQQLVMLAPATATALIVNLGDFLHADNFDATTARSGHRLDVDSRWPKIMRVAIRALIATTQLALAKHERVIVQNLKGNHDDQSSLMLALCLDAFFANEPRVHIDTSPSMFRWHEFGSTLIGMTHGHTVKARDLPAIMAHDMPEAWGRTKHRYFYCGHVHHESKKEYPGVVVETFNTLAARDAWHQESGYRSRRQMSMIVLDRERGEIQRHRIGVESL